MNEFIISKLNTKKILNKILIELNSLVNFYLPERNGKENLKEIKKKYIIK